MIYKCVLSEKLVSIYVLKAHNASWSLGITVMRNVSLGYSSYNEQLPHQPLFVYFKFNEAKKKFGFLPENLLHNLFYHI